MSQDENHPSMFDDVAAPRATMPRKPTRARSEGKDTGQAVGEALRASGEALGAAAGGIARALDGFARALAPRPDSHPPVTIADNPEQRALDNFARVIAASDDPEWIALMAMKARQLVEQRAPARLP